MAHATSWMDAEDILLIEKNSFKRKNTVRFHSQDVPSSMESEIEGEVEGSGWARGWGMFSGDSFSCRRWEQ